MLKDKIEKIILKTWTNERASRQILSLIRSHLLKAIPKERTEGILGILGTRHADGVRNEGYNQALSDCRKVIEGMK